MIEIILSVGIFALAVTAFVGVWAYAQEGAGLGGARVRAALVAEEGGEAVRTLRDQGFLNLLDGTYGIGIAGNQWQFQGASDILGIFERTVTVSPIDSHRKNITVTVHWQQNIQRTGQIDVQTRMTDWRRSFGNWSIISQQSAGDASGGADATGIALYKKGEYLYAVIVRNASSNTELEVFNVTNPSSPLLVRSLELGADAQDIAIAGDYAVIASVKDSSELQIVDLSQVAELPLTITGIWDASGGANPRAIAVVGTTVFLGRNSSANPELFAISIANPALPVQLGADIEFSGDIRDIAVAQGGDYLYLATTVNSSELSIVSISNPSSMTVVGSYNASGDSDGTAVASFSTYGILGRANGSYLMFSALTPSLPVLTGSGADLGSRITGIALAVGNAYGVFTINSASTALVVIDVSNPIAPVSLSSLDIGDSAEAVVYDFDVNRVFVAGTYNSAELAIIQPQ